MEFKVYSHENQLVFNEAQHVLVQEAEWLDNGKFHEWFSFLAQDIVYRIPIRVTRERNASPFSDQSWHMNDTHGSLEMRIQRTYTDYNWAEDPPSRTRRFLTNFRLEHIERHDDYTEVAIKSNLLLYRSKFDYAANELISCERIDKLRKRNCGWELANRMVLLDHTTMGMNNLGIFL